ncbi:NMD3-related protein [Candidatus Undinarchaeota archaeon]
MEKKICEECGTEYAGFCPVCYIKAHPPAKIGSKYIIESCSVCKKHFSAGRWKDDFDQVFEDRIKKELKWDSSAENKEIIVKKREFKRNKYHVDIELNATLKGFEWAGNERTLVTVALTACKLCCKKAGKYFEATIQLRAKNRKLEPEELEYIRAMLVDAVRAEVYREEDTKAGVDIFVSPMNAGKRMLPVLRNLGFEVKDTLKYIGQNRQTGKAINRLTVSAKRPEYTEGDIVSYAGKFYIVEKIRRTLTLLDFEGTETNAKYAEVVLVAKKGEILKGQVISVGNQINFMAEDYKTYDLDLPKIKVEVGELPYILIEDTAYPIWKSRP